MKGFKKINTIYKMLGSFLIIALLITAFGVQSVTTLRSILSDTDGLYNNNTHAISHMLDVMQYYQRTRVIIRDVIMIEDAETKQSEIENLESKYVLIDEAISSMKPLLHEDHAALLSEITQQMEKAREYNQMAIDSELKGSDGYLILMSEEADAAASAVQDSLSRLEQEVIDEADSVYAAINTKGTTNTTIFTVVLLVCDALAILMGVLLTRMVVKPLLITAGQIKKLAEGEDAGEINLSALGGEFRIIGENLLRLRETIHKMNSNILLLADAGTHGKLSVRADTEGMKGYYLDMVAGINKTLDAVIEPVNEAAGVLGELSRGNLNARVEGEYEGDHAIIKEALNTTVDALNAQIGEVSTVLEKVAEGDLTEGVTGEFVGDFDTLKQSVNRIVDALNTVLSDINTAAEQVAGGTKQVSDGSQAISQGATEQASSIEELTASIASIAEQTRQNALNANQSRQLASRAREGAVDGDAKMRELQQAMEEINESSSRISKVIKAIDDIAFQTNILALNAAVEAARAGVHGKGFAVVAEEVRNLAGKSANAAKETAALIEDSIRKTEVGANMAKLTAGALSSIVGGMEENASITEGIAAASSDQATAIAQVNKGIEQMSQVVQTNSATAQEAAAASEELSGQAELLKNMIGRFKLKGQIVRKPAATVAPKLQNTHEKISLHANDFGKY